VRRLAYEHKATDDRGKLLVEIEDNDDVYIALDNRKIGVRINHMMSMADFDEMYDELHRTQRLGAD
jgi:hypothetical protein